ncbi:8-amino-7-oxononanoate synthase [Alkalinema sp. FACHB-956]|uniref:8-amino-7-oxononanoate synthase n=1 Tax=Alkalinema sp. FACHB-956 TaxID=2692768 RepID=UPI00168225AB|nr:8-amino-7-oxononanoate synthase [Alkalinema sp. FACHB-956]MBD2325534.1 8-amino-7-oxononanoate synthase [Alkalinema sp. FACHB-956]
MHSDPYAWLDRSLETLHKAGWYRSTKTVTGKPGTRICVDGQALLNFASNDYLGLAGDDRLIAAAVAATQAYGTGTTGSRLITGHRDLHRQLERAIAALKQTEDAIVFSSGYAANLGTIAALMGQRDLILSDQYNHSSLRSGALVSGARLLEYRHGDLAEVRSRLVAERANFPRCLILTDSVFSMDGDLAPLPELLDLAEEFSCMVLVDEAHGTGVMGQSGAGCVEHFGCTGRSLIQMGTLSKALGSLGGYVAGSAKLVDFLRNRAPSWIYTTGLTAADTAAALAALEIVKTEPDRRDRLWANVAYLKTQLERLSHQNETFRLLPSDSPIVCLGLADVATAMQMGQALQTNGIFAPAIRPPTVPTSRIRMTVMATHSVSDIDQLVDAIQRSIAAIERCR